MLANTIGGLAFLLVLAVVMMGLVIYSSPQILTENLPDAYLNEPYSAWLAAREGLGLYTWEIESGELPPGLTLDARTGCISGTPNPQQGAETRQYSVTMLCHSESDDEGDEKLDRREITITVSGTRPPPPAPVKITTEPPLPTGYAEQPYQITFACEGGVPPFAWQAQTVPPGMALAPNGVLSGRPAVTGVHEVAVAVASAAGDTDAAQFEFAVETKHPEPEPPPPLAIVTQTLPPAVVGEEYTLFPAAEGGVPPYTWRLNGSDATWFRARENDQRVFQGMPELTDIGETEVALSVYDVKGESAETDPMTLVVLPSPDDEPPPLNIKTQALPDGTVGKGYEAVVAVEGGYLPYAWQVSGNHEQFGLTFDSVTGAFRGEPSGIGEVSTTVRISDRAESEVSRAYQFTLYPPVPPVHITTKNIPPGRAQRPYEVVLAAEGGYAPYTWSIVEGDLPPGLSFTPEEGRLHGTPSEAGFWQFAANVADAMGATAPAPVPLEYQLYTAQGFLKLDITTERLPDLLKGAEGYAALACEGGEPPYVWSVKPAPPPGLMVSGSAIVGIPEIANIYELELTVTDGSGQEVSVALPLTVRDMVDAWMLLWCAILAAALFALMLLFLLLWWLSRSSRKPLEILTESLPNARASCEYSVQLACQGGAAPYRWTIVEGSLPQGLELTEEGRITGLPFEGVSVDQTKEVVFTVEVKDQKGMTAQKTL